MQVLFCSLRNLSSLIKKKSAVRRRRRPVAMAVTEMARLWLWLWCLCLCLCWLRCFCCCSEMDMEKKLRWYWGMAAADKMAYWWSSNDISLSVSAWLYLLLLIEEGEERSIKKNQWRSTHVSKGGRKWRIRVNLQIFFFRITLTLYVFFFVCLFPFRIGFTL